MPTPISHQAPQPAADAGEDAADDVAETPDLVKEFADDKLSSSDTLT